MKTTALQEHIFGSYLSLRYGMGIVAAIFPILLYLVGEFHCVGLQNSISAYYWADGFAASPVRVWFVGGLFALAAFMYLYKGFTVGENVALNLAAIFAVGVAVFPMDWECQTNCRMLSLHGTCAVLLFVCLAYVVVLRSQDTLKCFPQREGESTERFVKIRTWFRWAYYVTGAIMLASPLLAVGWNTVFGTATSQVFFIEALGVWAFGFFWLVKSLELRRSCLTRRALAGEIDLQPRAGLPSQSNTNSGL